MPVMVPALPRNSNVCVHTCALKTVLHTMRGDKAASAWVAYVKPFVGSADSKEAAVQSELPHFVMSTLTCLSNQAYRYVVT